MNKKLTTLLLIGALALTSSNRQNAVSAAEGEQIGRLAELAFRTGIGYGICDPFLEFNLVLVPYTDGVSKTDYDRAIFNPVVIRGRTTYLQVYGPNYEDIQLDVLHHEIAHLCVTEETYIEPIDIGNDLEIIGSNGFLLIVRNKNNGLLSQIDALEEGRATAYILNVTQNREDVVDGLSVKSPGYIETSILINILSRDKNISAVTLSFSEWYEKVTGEPIQSGRLRNFIDIFIRVFNQEFSPEDAAEQIQRGEF